jgi:hypothetical protein
VRDFVYLVVGVVAALVLGAFVLLSVVGVEAWVAGVVFLALAVLLYFWDFERDAVFKDDFIEIGQVTASLVAAAVGLALLVAHLLA